GQGRDLAFGVHRELLLEVAVGHRRHDLCDTAYLVGQVTGHEVHVVGEVLPRARDPFHFRLAAELPFSAYLAGHTRHLRRKGVELVQHRIDRVFQLPDLAFHVHGDLLGEVAVGHGGGHRGDVAHLARQVTGHGVHVVGEVLPRTGDADHLGLAAELPFGAYLAGDAGHLRGERVELVHHGVNGVLQLADLAFHVHRDLLGKVAVGHGLRHVGDVPYLGRQVTGHRVHVVG